MTFVRVTRLAAGLVTLAACGGGHPVAAPTTGPTDTVAHDGEVEVRRDGACRSYADTLDREHEIDTRNQAALTRALTEANLTAVTYDVDWFELDQGARGTAGADGWQVVEADGGRTLLSPETRGGCGSEPWPLVVDGSGHLFALVVQHRERVRHELSVCGCDDQIQITCGGAMPPPIRWRWRLPAGVTFDGPFSIVADHESYLPLFAGRADGRPCPIRTMPP